MSNQYDTLTACHIERNLAAHRQTARVTSWLRRGKITEYEIEPADWGAVKATETRMAELGYITRAVWKVVNGVKKLIFLVVSH